MDPAIRNISFKNYVDGSYVLYGMLAEKPSTLYSMSDFRYLLEDPVYYRHRNRGGAAYRRFSSNRRAQSRYGIQQSEVASMVGFDRIRRQFHRHKSLPATKIERLKYPAGSPLNDKMGVRYVSYAEYIENDYHSYSDLGKRNSISIQQTVVGFGNPDDLRVVEYTLSSLSIYSFILYFTSVPDNPGEVHTFTAVEFTTSDGTVKTASITCTPEVDPALQ